MIYPFLVKTFQTTRFIVCAPDREIILRIGELNPKLNELTAKYEAFSCAFVTAWNPGSVRLSELNNQERQTQLMSEVRRRGYPFLLGRGIGESEEWPSEPSILVTGIRRESAEDLGRLFEQLAIVFAERGNPPELLLCQE